MTVENNPANLSGGLSALFPQGARVAEMRELLALVRSGAVAPPPIGRRPMSEATKTLEDLHEGRIVGRVVMTP